MVVTMNAYYGLKCKRVYKLKEIFPSNRREVVIFEKNLKTI